MYKRINAGIMALAAAIMVPVVALMIPGAGVEADAAGIFAVGDYGAIPGDGVNDLKGINDAILAARDAGGGTVTMPAGDFTITLDGMGGNGYGLELWSNVTLQMDKNTKLNVTGNSYGNYEVIRIKGMSNVTVTGGQLLGEKSKHNKSGDGNDGHGIVIRDSENVKITNMTIKNNWGDGIYIGNLQEPGKGGVNVKITNCTIAGNRRNNIAIVHGTNVTIDKCTIKKAKGVQPQCGINIEPNTNGGNIASDQMCKNINIKNTKVTCVTTGVDNNYFALQIMNPYFQSNDVAIAKKVNIVNCDLKGDVGNYAGKSVTFKKCKIKGTLYDKKVMKTKVKKTTVKGGHYKF